MKSRMMVQMVVGLSIAMLAAAGCSNVEVSSGNGSEKGNSVQDTSNENSNQGVGNGQGDGTVGGQGDGTVSGQGDGTVSGQGGGTVSGQGGGTVSDQDEEKDSDKDGVYDKYDNCPNHANPLDAQGVQADRDLDGWGDACDTCPDITDTTNANTCKPDEKDYTGSAVYKFREGDDDKDGVKNIEDNCQTVNNPGQEDSDGDGVGDVCDNCPNVPNLWQRDSNGDGTGDACQTEPTGPPCGADGACEDGTQCYDQGGANICVCDNKAAVVERVKPNIMLLLDASGSMNSRDRVPTMKQALNELVDATASEVRYGVAYFGVGPDQVQTELKLAVGDYSADRLKNVWVNFQADGFTPTGDALRKIYTQGWLDDPVDAEKRNKVILVLTDGDPFYKIVTNFWGRRDDAASFDASQRDTVAAAKEVFNSGIKVWLLGVKYDGGGRSKLQEVARAGSGNTQDFFDAQSTAQLSDKLKDIVKKSGSCDLKLSSNGGDPNQVWVKLGEEHLSKGDENGFDFDKDTMTVTLKGNACTRLQKDSNLAVTAILGCAAQCIKTTEDEDPSRDATLCNHIDDDCDGTVDEGCSSLCGKEICGDNKDNDCDGEVDEGCPDRKVIGSTCTEDSECAVGVCDKLTKKCAAPCRELGRPCDSSGNCCSGVVCLGRVVGADGTIVRSGVCQSG